MRVLALICSLPLLVFPVARGVDQNYGLPSGAVIIETRPVSSHRSLLLWMLNPTRNPRENPGELYTCPEETRGSYYSGRTRVSLVDTKASRIINTVKIKEDEEMEGVSVEGDGEFDIPYKIHRGYYHVARVSKGLEGKPTVMFLKDYNGDGKALEFALFDAEACMGLQTTLIGYSESQDKVIQYPISLTVLKKGARKIENGHWADYLFSRKQISPGHWKYEIDYRGRGGTLDKYEFRYNKAAERFEGTVEFFEDQEE
jgi:hypothetical protein